MRFAAVRIDREILEKALVALRQQGCEVETVLAGSHHPDVLVMLSGEGLPEACEGTVRFVRPLFCARSDGVYHWVEFLSFELVAHQSPQDVAHEIIARTDAIAGPSRRFLARAADIAAG